MLGRTKLQVRVMQKRETWQAQTLLFVGSNPISDTMMDKDLRRSTSCKVGTIPALIIPFRKYRWREGLFIKFRHYNQRQWITGRVWKVNGSYPFIELM